MRLLNCQLQNVKLHGDLSLDFSQRITLIGGANESGKSTLVEALHRALFLKASATGAPVEALQSKVHLGQPVVSLAFEAKGDTWTLRKRFSGTSGQVSLHSEASGQQLSGPVAEELLAELVGVKETVGSRQATTILPTRWAHLWVMQGSAGNNLLEAGKASYDFDALLARLEQSGGAVVQQSQHDQRVAQRIDAALEENFTTRGVKKNSPLWQRQEELEHAELVMEQALARLGDYEDAGAELAAIGEQLEQLQGKDLPALEERRRLISQGAEASSRLDAAVQLAVQALEPLRLRHDATQSQLQQVDALIAELGERRQQLEQLQESQKGAVARELALTTALEERRTSRTALASQKQVMEQRHQLVQLLLEQARTLQALHRLGKDLEQQSQGSARLLELEQQLAALPPLSRSDLQHLRDLQQQCRDARTRQQAMAAGVRLLRADQPVRINGEPLQSGEQRQLSSTFELQVGDGVALEITPGGGQALGDLEAACIAADQAFNERLTQLAMRSLEAAEQAVEQRSALEQQLSALAATPRLDLQALQVEQHTLQQRLGELEPQLDSLRECWQELEQEQPLPSGAAELQALQQQLGQTLSHTTAASRQAEADLEVAQAALQECQKTRLNEASQLQILEAECSDRRSRLDALQQSHGSRDGLVALLTALAADRQQAEAELQRLQAERAALGGGDNAQELAALQEQIDALQRQIEQLIDQRGAAKQRCDSISNDDPYAAAEQARAQLEAAQADHQSIRRLTEAHKLLQQLFLEAQADLSSRYSEPLAQSIGSYLRPLIPDGPVAQLNYDQSRGFGGLRLRRGQEFYDFEQLSGGMREQLAAALRLSMADVLKGSHDGCLPLVFDDAFTNSDPERVQLVKRMLGTAVDRGLQVILLTCDPAAYGAFADQVVELDR
ncbi:MAG: AAA family ATPase [Synechococcaceae cyanobacterium]|nr:AAA family ATPase [Synechococcaceae cyanobacterium]